MVWKPDYITGEQLASYLTVQDSEDYDADLLADWATTASRSVDNSTGRQFGKSDNAVARVFESAWDRAERRYVTAITDLHAVTGLVVTDANGNAVTSDRYELWPPNALADGMVYERIAVPGCGKITITSEFWGWPAVPASIKIAAKLQGARLAFRRGAAHGIAGSPENGAEQRLLAKLDPDVLTSVKPYVRKWWAA